eukprot:CAMPEP_0114417214 /NCGR_PEP_ID=MMETSP0103-20121206/2843_1 /TAXON_ID=37642 ORGANISM="Paraphysomonas imperforata, Strain PA2" /NCGR_SAMPLE_ID=MMETSP0103 /ASSEMBLY_ACC=CAM_ASM_000201 /LENGTH=647 /DNA_ID=CAMNT_0001585489 /DNA_START=288 /DNA_END=2231 /DNA_ORIENTATION=-
MGIDHLMKNMRFYQNTETSEVLFIVGSDRIENVPKITVGEWIEVNVSGLQDNYVRQTMQSKSFFQREFVRPCPVEDTASLSTDAHLHHTIVSGNDGEILSHDDHDHDDDDVEADVEFKSHTNSIATDHSSQRSVISKNKIKIPWECPYCDHTFGRYENKNQHIAACRSADEHDTQTIKQYVDVISQHNHDVMSDAVLEAVQQFEEQVHHRRNVLLLLKQLQNVQNNSNRDSIDAMEALSAEFRIEKKELAHLLIPCNVNTRNSTYAMKRNEELHRMMDYLDEGVVILKRKIASKSSFHMEDFTVGNILRKGSFSTVHLAKCNANGQLYAVKIMRREFILEQKMEHQIARECEVMQHTTLYPDMFLRLFFHELKDDYICILMEYVSTGDCLQLMKYFGGKLSHELAKHIISNLIVGVSFLHSHGVVHRDIKPDNLLITPQGNVKLVDFGMSAHHPCNSSGTASDSNAMWLEEMDSAMYCAQHTPTTPNGKSETDISISSFRFGCNLTDEDLLKTLVGNVNYAAPEVLEGEGYDHCIDWWALGVLYFHFISGIPPFYAVSDSDTKLNVVKGRIQWSKLPGNTSEDCRDFIAALLERSPRMRLGAQGAVELQEHGHFVDTDFKDILQKPGPFLPKETVVDFKPLEVDLFL